MPADKLLELEQRFEDLMTKYRDLERREAKLQADLEIQIQGNQAMYGSLTAKIKELQER